ncbi:hypothetical protein F4801DRAFT_587936 [Xylaria longipes]|nr:hypothetical protein F4801DRAFT_587936 [Xylaria longipes]
MGILPILEVREDNVPTGDHRRWVYIPSWVFVILCSIVVGTRFWYRKRTDGGLGADDYTIMASLVFAIATHAIALWGCGNGYGKHGADLTDHQTTESYKSFYMGQITYKISIGLTKSSILLLYLRIFSSVRWLRRTCYALLALVISNCIATTFVTIFQCNPVVAAFDKDITNKTCINISPFWYANAFVSIGTDLIILVIPMPLICALQMPRLRKAALIIAFGLGACVVAASILRVATLDTPIKSPDPLYDIETTMYSLIEMSLAIICACLPQLFRLVTKLFPRVKSAYCNLKDKFNLVKPVGNRQQASDEEEGKWTQIGPRKGVELTNVICRGDAGSEIASPHEGGGRKMKILKTVDYTLEYSKSGTDS